MEHHAHTLPLAGAARSGRYERLVHGMKLAGVFAFGAFRLYYALGVYLSALISGVVGLLLLATTSGGRAVAGGVVFNRVFLALWVVAPFVVLRAWLGEVGLASPLFGEAVASVATP